MAKQPARHADGRRKRTTQVMIAVPTNFTALSQQLGISPATVAARYHRVHDMYPNRCVTLQALSESHKTSEHRGQYTPKPSRKR